MPLHRHFKAAALLALVIAAGLLGGCGQKAAPAPVAPSAEVPAANLTQMTPEEKTSQIATSFPLQVPVASGAVVRGEAQGDSAWVYQVIVPGSVPAVRGWYLQAYRNAEWTLAKNTDAEVSLQKGTAQSRLQFEKVDNGNEARTQVTASVGVGTPVLQTQ